MPLHDDTKSQLNARYLEGLASIEKRKIKNEARGAAVGLCLFGVDNRTNRGFIRLGNLARTFALCTAFIRNARDGADAHARSRANGAP